MVRSKKKKKSGKEKITIANLENFTKIVYYLKLILNIRKEDISILVNGLKHLGRIISILGNNLDDFQLIKTANISIGNNNNAIFKENYSLTLLDNSFNSFWNAYI